MAAVETRRLGQQLNDNSETSFGMYKRLADSTNHKPSERRENDEKERW